MGNLAFTIVGLIRVFTWWPIRDRRWRSIGDSNLVGDHVAKKEGRRPIFSASVSTLVALLVFAASWAQSSHAGDSKPGLDSIEASTTNRWSFEISLTQPFTQDAPPASSIDQIVAAISSISGGTIEFPKRTVAGTLSFTSSDSLSSSQVLTIRNQLMSLDEVSWVRTRQLSHVRAKLASVQTDSPSDTALGFIVKPTTTAVTEGWVDAAGFTSLALVRFRELTGIPFATSSAMAAGMIALRLESPLQGADVSRVQSAIASASFVEWVEPDTHVEVGRIPNDPFYSRQWNLSSTWGINAPAAWDITTGSPNVVVAVIDTGILKTHPDLSSRILPGYDFISDPARARDGDGRDPDPSDEGDWAEIGECSSGAPFKSSSWHGSHVAGIIGAASNNSYGASGVTWGARILPVRVLGRCGGTLSDIIDGMSWAAGLHVPGIPDNPTPARIINMSLGSRTPKPTCSQAYQVAIKAISTTNAMLVVAAGNNALTSIGEAGFYEPSGCAGVVTVAATDHLGLRSSYSDYSTDFVVDISAPGGDSSYYHDQTIDIFSTVDLGIRIPKGPAFAYYEGTSQATPHVSGILGLMLSVNPTLTNKQLLLTLLETTSEFNPIGTCYRNSLCGVGIANAHAAVSRAQTDPANAPTSISVTSSANPSIAGQSFTLSASVSPTNVTGTVSFLNDGVALTGCTNLALTNGRTSCTFNNWTANLAGYDLQVVFNGDYTHHWVYSSETLQVVLPTGTTANYTGLFWKSPANSESGWGINLSHQGDVIFATWFTYDLTGKAWWLSMTANKTGNGVYSGTLYQTHGPAFDAIPFSSAAVSSTAVGSGTLSFSDVNNGVFSYKVNGIAQSKSITRQVFGPVPTCVWGAQQNLALATNFQDLWWASPSGSESGWGVNFIQQGNTIFATWFTYNGNGSPLWLSATANNVSAGVYQGALYLTSGPPFNAVPFNPANVVANTVGTATLRFANGNSATFTYTVNTSSGPVTQTKAITRQVFRTPGTVCQ